MTNIPDYVGGDYGALTAASVASVAAQRLAARAEGVLLDPTYAVKAVAAAVDLVATGRGPPGRARSLPAHRGALAVFLARNRPNASAPTTDRA